MTKILCIDDTPEEILSDGESLKEIILDIFRDTPYEVSFKKSGVEGIKTAEKDNEISLVLLDVEFNKKVEGPEIADKLRDRAPHAKVIVLTRLDDKGKKISFGSKENVVHYILKKELAYLRIQQRLKNLSMAIIEDYENRNWEIEYPAAGTINLMNKSSRMTYGIDIPSSMDSFMKLAIASPNRPVINPGGSTQQQSRADASLNKLLNTINTKVLEETDWNTWGILSREKCGKGQLKLVVGSLLSETRSCGTYVLMSDFEEFKKNLQVKLAGIEQHLKYRKK
jgi:CheY-like chemotaxis protein